MQSLKSSSEEHAIYDSHYERIGKVDDVRVGKPYRVTHVGFKIGFIGNTESKETIRHAPTSARTRPSLLSSRNGCVPSSGWIPCIPCVAWRGSYAADARAALRRHAV